MGSVSNVVYEQVLEAVDANDSSKVIATIAVLLDAYRTGILAARAPVRALPAQLRSG